jgi:hypothetical protein
MKHSNLQIAIVNQVDTREAGAVQRRRITIYHSPQFTTSFCSRFLWFTGRVPCLIGPSLAVVQTACSRVCLARFEVICILL